VNGVAEASAWRQQCAPHLALTGHASIPVAGGRAPAGGQTGVSRILAQANTLAALDKFPLPQFRRSKAEDPLLSPKKG